MKNRKIAIWAVAIAAVIGLTACSGGATPAEPAKPSSSAAPAAPQQAESSDAVDASIAACLQISAKLSEAYAKMAEVMNSSDASDMQTTIDLYTELAHALGGIADSTSDTEFKAAAQAAQADFTAIRDGMQRYYVDGDISGLTDLMTATASMQTSYPALLAFCSPN